MPQSAYELALAEHFSTFHALAALQPQVEQVAGVLADALRSGGKVMLCGNGGSASDSQHIAAELTGRFVKDRAPLAGLALTTDTSALTSIGNDYDFGAVFERQVRGLGRAGDCLIGLSTSGNSENVIRAVEAAHALGITTIGLLGRDGGRLAALCRHAVVVPSNTTARIQEAHIFVGHLWCQLIEQRLGVGQ
ncbi:D-sedoheptulose-7-phosphate isomerase [Ideonella sp. BN130291]|uniref:D-sedoheptulose-7-phosphate isomerase n=1 Tax=Ideonella sp. BN130291 TaxID=3112940 RepID=UPI002E260DDB|nr:D-sedoheptulose 7-phosphate isomerase [Ideonella sp. BN130291]